jgi:hypothetical protein
MKKELLQLLEQHKGDIARQLELASIAEENVKSFLVRELIIASEANDRDAGHTLFQMAYSISDVPKKLEILHEFLLIPGHYLHQQTAKALQEIASPSSIPTLVAALENGFANFQYTCSDDDVIAKWFSHALADTGTPEAIAAIERFAQSNNEGVASEMRYRLKRLRAAQWDQAYEYARSRPQASCAQKKEPSTAHLAIALIAIFLFASWTTVFLRTCHSDNCIGAFFPMLGLMISCLIQTVFILMHCSKRDSLNLPFAWLGAAWVAGSIVAMFPMLFSER